MPKSKEKTAIIKRCREICNKNNAKDSEALIKKEYNGCCVDVDMTYSKCGRMKMFTGLMLYKSFNIIF